MLYLEARKSEKQIGNARASEGDTPIMSTLQRSWRLKADVIGAGGHKR